ncbi:restriction endonuclease subunit S [Ligilactobacillus salivarius]|uniref:restriction endonuclease subunit S n=2 Tax=Ligilactobacillus salivarius TaxID=1624 RepID=UPI003F1F3D1E
MAKEEKKAPKLRFNGYTNDWEQQELGAVVEFYSGLTYKPENVVQNGTLVIRSSNIHNNQYINADNVYVKDNIVNSEYVQEQDIIVVVRNGSRNLIGKHALLKSIPHDPSVIGAFMTGIRSLNNQFIEAVLNTEKFKREINKNLGATINQITTSQFKKMKFNFPKREEDKQIGILFNYLDDTIQLHERKCEELALIKQALLQKLFPKKDEVIPEVRYKSFSAAWEQRKLGEVIVSEHKGKVKSSMKGGNTNYLETNYLNGGIAQKVNATADVSKNDVLILWDGSKAGTVYHGFEGALGSTLKVYVPKCSGDFLYQILKKDQDKIYQRYRTPNIPHVIKNFTEKFIVSIPNVREQEKIAEFFHDLDSLIVLHQRKLEKLKQLKKFLLQNMFI